MINKYKFLTLIITIIVFQGILFAQQTDLTQTDISEVNVDQLSDSQIGAILNKAEEAGMTIDQVVSSALARGMSPTEANKLKNRLEKVKSGKATKTDSEKFQDRSRKNKYADESMLENDETTLGKRKQTDETEETDQDIFGSAIKGKKKEIPEEKVFGYAIFNNKKITFEPSLNIPTPKNYLLGPDDEIIIDIWGASQEMYEQKISPEGNILIDNFGPIYLNGLTIEEATNKLKKELSKIYAGLRTGNTFLKISLGEVRSIKVNIVGNALFPGTYTLPSLATVFNALYESGGPSYNGTLRSVKVIRDNKAIADIDFYDYLLSGEQSNNIRLQDQDVIFIPPYLNRIIVKGEVKRPFQYDVLPKESLKDLITFAGGYTGNAYTHRIKITRRTGREKKILDVPTESADTFHLFNYDEVTIDSVLNRFENRVVVKGAVFRQGEFAIDNALTLKQLIEKADGLRGDAFKNRASIYRTKEDYTLEVIPVDLVSLLNSNQDIELKREDIVVIPSIFDLKEEYYISVYGEVLKQGEYQYIENTTIEDAIVLAGGLKESASLARLEVARRIKNPNVLTATNQIVETFQFPISENLKLTNETSKFTLMPFDQVYIRRTPGYEDQSTIVLEGEVLFPGRYTITNKNERISDVIRRAGGLTPEAFTKGSKLVRLLPVSDKNRRMALDTTTFKSKQDSLKFRYEMEDSTSTLGINLDKVLSNPGSKYDIFLQADDIITVPKELQTVRLSGKVASPTLVRYDRSFSFLNYISNAGGFAADAAKSKSYVIYANGTRDRTKKILVFNSYPKIEPGAEIIVPKKDERTGLKPGELVSISSALLSAVTIIAAYILR